MTGETKDFFSARDTRVLPREEQLALIELAQRETTARAFLQHAKEDASFVLKATDRRKLELIVREGNLARGKIIQHSLRFVWRMIHRYKHHARMTDESDLLSEGILGLMKAVDAFDSSRENNFLTYAGWWVRAFIGRYANGNCAPVHVPNGLVEAAYRIRKQRRSLAAIGWQPSEVNEHLTKEYGTDALFVERLTTGHGVVAFDAPIGENEDGTLHDVMADDAMSSDVLLEGKGRLEAIAAALKTIELSPRERSILERRFMGDETLKDIADDYGLSRERIRQIESKMLPRLTKHMRRALPDEVLKRGESVPHEWTSARVRKSSEEKRAEIQIVVKPPPIRRPEVAANGLRIGEVVPAAEKADRRPRAAPPSSGSADVVATRRDYTLSTHPDVSDAFDRGERRRVERKTARASRTPPVRNGLVRLPPSAAKTSTEQRKPSETTEQQAEESRMANGEMSEKARAMLDLYERGDSYTDIAKALDTTVAAVASCIHKLRKDGLVKRPKHGTGPKQWTGPKSLERPTSAERKLTDKQQAVLNLARTGIRPIVVSRRLKMSRSSVNTIYTTLRRMGLLKERPKVAVSEAEAESPALRALEEELTAH